MSVSALASVAPQTKKGWGHGLLRLDVLITLSDISGSKVIKTCPESRGEPSGKRIKILKSPVETKVDSKVTSTESKVSRGEELLAEKTEPIDPFLTLLDNAAGSSDRKPEGRQDGVRLQP